MQFISSDKLRIFFKLVDATDGLTVESGEAAGQPQLSVYGADYGNINDTLHAIDSGTNGSYYADLTASEYNSISAKGQSLIRYKSANTAEFEDVLVIQALSNTTNDQLKALILSLTQKINFIEHLLQKGESSSVRQQDISVT